MASADLEAAVRHVLKHRLSLFLLADMASAAAFFDSSCAPMSTDAMAAKNANTLVKNCGNGAGKAGHGCRGDKGTCAGSDKVSSIEPSPSQRPGLGTHNSPPPLTLFSSSIAAVLWLRRSLPLPR